MPKNVINRIAHILQQSTARPRLQNLSLPSMLPQIQTQDPSLPIITHPSAPGIRVEPVVQHPRVQILMTAPTPPPRVNHSLLPSLDPF